MKDKIFSMTKCSFSGTISEIEFNGVYVSFDGENAQIGYSTNVQKARALFLLSMKINQGCKEFEISEKPLFDTLGVMLDMSRGGVMRVEAVKEYIDRMVAMGFNMLMLYTEDVYEIEGYPFFGYLRGRYKKEQLREIDDYAFNMGVEVIPCIQTLGHLSNYIKWGEAAAFSENATVILPDEEKTYEFIEAEIRAMRECFRSNRIHLGMDEAAGLGLGKHLKRFGMESGINIFNRHLDRVLKIAQKYNYSPYIWGDMYFGYEDPKNYYKEGYILPQFAIDDAPKNANIMFWQYDNFGYNFYDKKFEQYERFPNQLSYAGGVWTWDGFITNFEYTLNSMKPALECAVNHGVKTVMATMWANGGCETDYFEAFAALAVFSEFCYKGKGCTDDDIYAAGGHIIGADKKYIDAANDFHISGQGADNIGRGLFYCDPLINLLCRDLEYEKTKQIYENALSTIKEYKGREFYNYYVLLFEIVLMKADIVLNLQKEYKADNREYLKNMAEEKIPALIKLYDEFYKVFSENWLKKYKPFGFEIYAGRFGGIKLRLQYASETILKYLSGELSQIEELEEEIISGQNRTWRYAKNFMETII